MGKAIALRMLRVEEFAVDVDIKDPAATSF
jgi:hypothetical protein